MRQAVVPLTVNSAFEEVVLATDNPPLSVDAPATVNAIGTRSMCITVTYVYMCAVQGWAQCIAI